MANVGRFSRHDNAVGPGRTAYTREELIQAQAYIIMRHPLELRAAIIDGGEWPFVSRALAADVMGMTKAEYEEVYRRIVRGSILAEGAPGA